MNPIRKEIIVNASIEKVWDFITDSEKLAKWLMPNDFELKPNKKFTFTCEGHDCGVDTIRCEIREIIPYEKLVYTWNTDQFEIETLVTIEIQKLGEKTKVTLIHSGWDKLGPEERIIRDEYDGGWEGFIMDELKAALET
ncbi:MAG: SRPBCC domain-containing protein [Deltaproteobacteria bacterium]